MVNEPMQFRGIWIPLVTPFRQGRVDKAALARLVGHLAAHGVAGFVACGSTGEAAMLDPDEQDLVLATTLDAAQGCRC
jgi:4-hydroxy-tetrahydrodipicolinate synthase